MMRYLAYLVPTLGLIVLSPGLAAQNWSSERQEVLRHIDACWAAWEVSWDEWNRVCRPSANMIFWWAADGAPQTMDEMKRTYVKPAKMHLTARRPIGIQIEGDLAVVHFYAMYDFIDGRTQDRIRGEQKRSEVFRRVNGQWTFIGGMASQVSTPD